MRQARARWSANGDGSLAVPREPIKFALPVNGTGGARAEAPLVRKAESRASRLRATLRPKRSRGAKGGFKLPPLSLLDMPPLEHAQIDEAALERSARVLEQKLADFGVEGRVVEVQPGPVVTMYKLEPGSGIKVSQIVNLADDLSMALRAATVRIQAPVPGEAVVGIEVPNRKREKIYLREILEAEEFGAAQSHLTIALGKDIAGQPVAADLATMPHLLIAGATGTGKSVSIHTMIASILFNATADDVRFILIDPKMLELSVYEGIPHLLVPVVVDPEKAAAALLWATQEMEGALPHDARAWACAISTATTAPSAAAANWSSSSAATQASKASARAPRMGRHAGETSQAAEDRHRDRRAGRSAAQRGQDR